jgi:selenocysteine lyase/cysteine desulfurase
VHLNNAGAGLMPVPVLTAVEEHLRLEAAMGGYEAADARAADVTRAYQAMARLLGCQPGNIAFVENATLGVAQALSAFDFQPGDAIITSRADYVSNQLMLLSLAERRGIRVVRADDLPEGGVDPASVDQLTRDRRAKLVVLSWIPTNSGLIQDVEAIGAICSRRGLPYLVDGCQAVGQIPVDVGRIGCDFLAGTARKFLRGPRGIGFLYVSHRVLAARRYPLYLDLRSATWTDPDRFEPALDARRFENWEFGYAQLLGLGAAAEYAIAAEAAGGLTRAVELGALARTALAEAPGLRPLDRGSTLGAIATFAVAGVEPSALVPALRERGINTSWFPRSAAVIDMDAKGISAGLRVSPHYYNTPQEIELLVEAIRDLGRPA